MGTSNILVGAPVTGTGGLLRGPAGTTLPTDSTTALDAALTAQGYISDDGVTMKIDRSVEKVKAWGGQTVRVIQSDFDVTFEFVFLETTEGVLKSEFGDDNVTTVAASADHGNTQSVIVKAVQLPSGVWVFDMLDGASSLRIVAPNASVTDTPDIKFTSKDVVGWGATIDALPDSSGNNAYIYTDDGQKTT